MTNMAVLSLLTNLSTSKPLLISLLVIGSFLLFAHFRYQPNFYHETVRRMYAAESAVYFWVCFMTALTYVRRGYVKGVVVIVLGHEGYDI